MLEPELRRKVDALWDKFWAGGLANPLVAIDQMNFLIFLKRIEEVDALQRRRDEAGGRRASGIFDGSEDCRWSYWRNLRAEEMFSHVQSVVFPWLRQIGSEASPFAAQMRDAAFLIPRASLLVEAVNIIDDLAITDRNVDTQGDIYEYMLSKLNVAGQIGQFRTPRHIIRALVALIDPHLGQTVIDPACGTGGFLIAAAQHMLRAKTSDEFITYDEQGAPHGLLGDQMTTAQWDWLKGGALSGFDVDPTMVRIGVMNMMLHGFENPCVSYADALGNAFSHAPRAEVVLANPPFSGAVDVDEISEAFDVRTRATELLFVQLIEQILRAGGRGGVIVPSGLLFNSRGAHKAIRRRLLDENKLHALVYLPSGVFKPYTGWPTAMLVFTRGGRSDRVWVYEVMGDGYTLDDNRLPSTINSLPDLLERWPGREDGPNSFTVDADEIRRNDYDFTLSLYRSAPTELVAEADPAALIAEARMLANELDRRLSTFLEKL